MDLQSENTVPPGSGIRAIWGSSPDDITAIGGGRRVLRFDGQTWTQTNSGIGWYGYVSDVWFRSHDDIYAAGNTVSHFDGTEWSTIGAREFGYFHAVWGTP
jgi:hypothetical protein